MDVKFGKLSNNFFTSSSAITTDENFFINAAKIITPQKNQANSNRLNDYDSNILENNAYQELDDVMLKLEHKIEILESSLSKINKQIAALESFDESIQVNQLIIRKKAIEEELIEFNKKYSELGLSAKISGQIASVVKFTSKKRVTTFSLTKDFLAKKVLAKISKKFNYSQNMKEALEKLSNINTNVDELITMQTPYGETINRYEKLTAYLNRANVIHSQISKCLKNFK